MFPSARASLKLHEVGPFYMLIGFGTITWHGTPQGVPKRTSGAPVLV